MMAKQALKKAVGLWGKTAAVQDQGHACTCGKKGCEFMHARFKVGKVDLGMFFSVKGQGASWEEAFDAAERSRKREEDRYKKIESERRRPHEGRGSSASNACFGAL